MTRVYPSTFENKSDLKLGETYLKFNLEYNSKNIVKIKAILFEALRVNLSEFASKDGIIFTIDTDPGSLKSRITWYGKQIIIGVGAYASFMQGLDMIIAQNWWISTKIIDYVEVQTNEGHDVIRSERRIAYPGRLRRVLERLNYIQDNLNNQGNVQTHKDLEYVKLELVNLLELLEPVERQKVLNSLAAPVRNNLPHPNQDVEHLYRLYALKPEDIEIVVEPQ